MTPDANAAATPSEQERSDTEQAMIRLGGRFVQALGRASLNADNGAHFAMELVAMRQAADMENQAKLAEAFPNVWDIFDRNEADRLQHLRDAWPAYFERYAAPSRQAPVGT